MTAIMYAKAKRALLSTVAAISTAFTVIAPAHAADSGDANNTQINDRDANRQTLTPLDQSNTSSDTNIVAKIRSSITDDKSLSTNAQNVKVIVRGGTVTLRGPVESAAEKTRVEAIARNVEGVTSVHNEIDFKR